MYQVAKCNDLATAVEKYNAAHTLFDGNVKLCAVGIWQTKDKELVFFTAPVVIDTIQRGSIVAPVDGVNMRLYPDQDCQVLIWAKF